MNLIILQILCVTLTIWASLDDKSGDAPLAVLASIIPVIGWIIGAVSLYLCLQRIIISKANCTVKHEFEITYDSEAEKWKNGRRPMRVSMGGVESFTCKNCSHQVTHVWKAF